VRFRNIQALRAFAAWAVLVHHVIDALNNYVAAFRIEVTIFEAGVDVFFVLSGFVMAESTAGGRIGAGAFLRARVARIVPVYWLLTLVAAAAIMSGLRLFGRNDVTLGWLAQSLLFMPGFDGPANDIKPILFVGWTLNYEMLFYLLFAVSLFVRGQRGQHLVLMAMLAALMVAGQATDSAWLQYYGSPMLLHFGAGVAVWHLARLGRPGRTAGLLIGGLGLAMLGAIAWLGFSAGGPFARLPIGIAATLLVYAAVVLEKDGAALGSRFVQRQGDASYALYLLHVFVLQVVGKVALVTGLAASDTGLVATVTAMVVASLVSAEVFHRAVERPMHHAARQWLGIHGVSRRGSVGRDRPAPVGPSGGAARARPAP